MTQSSGVVHVLPYKQFSMPLASYRWEEIAIAIVFIFWELLGDKYIASISGPAIGGLGGPFMFNIIGLAGPLMYTRIKYFMTVPPIR